METGDWPFNEKAHIELPISCSIESDKIRCGALKLTSNKAIVVEVGPSRMKEIKKQPTGEDRVRISGETFRGNFSSATSIFGSPKTTLGLSTFYWIIIGAVSGGLLITAVVICGYRLRNKGSGPFATKQPSGNTVVHNNIQINPQAKFRLGSLKRKRNNSLKAEELPFQLEEAKDASRAMTLGEQWALEAKESA